jgi:putative transposase
VVNAAHLVALVRAGAVFHKGKLLERPVDIGPDHGRAADAAAETDVA